MLPSLFISSVSLGKKNGVKNSGKNTKFDEYINKYLCLTFESNILKRAHWHKHRKEETLRLCGIFGVESLPSNRLYTLISYISL